MAVTVGYGDGRSSDETTMPPAIECSDRVSEATAAAAIGCAALPKAKIQTRLPLAIFSASTARVVAVPGAAATIAAS